MSVVTGLPRLSGPERGKPTSFCSREEGGNYVAITPSFDASQDNNDCCPIANVRFCVFWKKRKHVDVQKFDAVIIVRLFLLKQVVFNIVTTVAEVYREPPQKGNPLSRLFDYSKTPACHVMSSCDSLALVMVETAS